MSQQSKSKEVEYSLRFPDYFPENTPPKDAIAANGDFYRITNKEKPTNKCFLSGYDKSPGSVETMTALKKICSYGISLQDTIEGARETVGRFKNATSNKFIAKGTLNEKIGVEMQTFEKIYHHTLWCYVGVEVHILFKNVEMVQKR